MTGLKQICQIVSGDFCAKVAQEANISIDDFYFLNPGLDKTCGNLELGTAYCAEPVGDIATYPGYPQKTPSTSFARPPTSTVSFALPTKTLHPKAPGTSNECTEYVNSVNVERLEESYGSLPFITELNSCPTIAGKYGITIDDLLRWNPSLNQDNCNLKAEYSYCVAREDKGEFPGCTTQCQ